ncbi:MAG: hypothetical protein WBA38_04010 [Gordonia sp. (in: high G+C Gram-positive bacteria)]|uniref:LtfC-like domain-containing protein n=1 Tax=Gordonia sp. (in: high G+C Gram-positive bacteria) TaxID=84139 RepID=UPI003C721440
MSGNQPIKDTLILTRGADYIADFKKHASDPPINSATTARIEFTDGNDTDATILETWDAAEVLPDMIRFRTESETADLIDDRTNYRLIISFPDTPSLEHCWYFGTVKRIQ